MDKSALLLTHWQQEGIFLLAPLPKSSRSPSAYKGELKNVVVGSDSR